MKKVKKCMLTKDEKNEKKALKQLLSMSDQELEKEIYITWLSLDKKTINQLEKTHGKKA